MPVVPFTTKKDPDLFAESLPGEHRAQFVATGSELRLAQNDQPSPGFKLGSEMDGLTLESAKPEITPREHLALLKQLYELIPTDDRQKFSPAQMQSSKEELLTETIHLKHPPIKTEGVSVTVSVATYNTKPKGIGEDGGSVYEYSPEHAEKPIQIEIQNGQGISPFDEEARVPTKIISCNKEELPARLKEVLAVIDAQRFPDNYFTHDRLLKRSDDGTYPLVERPL